ncbi:unnamed protein product [Prorocentrum cordatum]|uniref:Uncharacterized protein n=1 Tax=Prorocentrum cordatum TaxID=2364126 RepID=A0ABN9SZS2_9DINO|nr:unnamed protein product [Polarella glacialis]
MPSARRARLAEASRIGRRIARSHISRLGDHIVPQRMLALYTLHTERFCWWAFGAPALPRRVDHVDVGDLLTEYIEMRWHEGDSKSYVAYLLAGVQHFMPRLRRHIPAA